MGVFKSLLSLRRPKPQLAIVLLLLVRRPMEYGWGLVGDYFRHYVGQRARTPLEDDKNEDQNVLLSLKTRRNHAEVRERLFVNSQLRFPFPYLINHVTCLVIGD